MTLGKRTTKDAPIFQSQTMPENSGIMSTISLKKALISSVDSFGNEQTG